MSNFPRSADIKVTPFTGQIINELIPQIARLRIEVFAEYPFLYDGNYAYEMRYLQKFLTMKEAIVVAAFDKDVLVGLATGYPFIYEAQPLIEVFMAAGRDPKEYFCFGEFVLQKPYRGRGLGRQFCDQMQAHVQRLNHYKYLCLYTAERPINDVKRPADYRSLAPYWKSHGFVEHPELIGTVSYKEIGEEEETPKKMVFWIKDLADSERVS